MSAPVRIGPVTERTGSKGYRLGVPPSLIFTMLVIIVVDALVGSIPVAGDLIDAVVKANKRNVEMLKDHLGV